MEKPSSVKRQKLTNLLFFSPYFYPYISGITQYPYKLFSEKKLSCKTTCLTFQYDSNLIAEEKLSEFLTIKRMPFLLRISKGFISPKSLKYFWNEAINADIVVINLPSFEGIILAIIAKLLKKPLLVLFHCEVQLPFSLANYLINFVLNFGVLFQLFCANIIIVETKDYFKDKLPYFLFKQKMEEIFPLVNNVQPDKNLQIKLQKLKEKYTHIIGFCGRIASEKGIEILINSMTSLQNMFLLLAGPTGKHVAGEETYFLKVKQLLDEKKVPYLFLGSISAEELCSFYTEIDILVLPSVNKTEAFGMVQVEAMLQGTPVVVSNLPGVRIPVSLTKMGILTRPYNSRDITNAIQEIIKNKNIYSNKKLGEGAKKIFDSKKTYDTMYSIIQKII
jgi:glycosyltransferase involved in cell wall biosynthesis